MKLTSSYISLLFLAFSSISNASVNTYCTSCFADTTNYNKYCPSSFGSSIGGTCCPSSSTSTAICRDDTMFCSDLGDQDNSPNMKYFWCNFNAANCGTPSRYLQASFHNQTIFTSLAWGASDVCPYQIVSNTDYSFVNSISVMFDVISNV